MPNGILVHKLILLLMGLQSSLLKLLTKFSYVFFGILSFKLFIIKKNLIIIVKLRFHLNALLRLRNHQSLIP